MLNRCYQNLPLASDNWYNPHTLGRNCITTSKFIVHGACVVAHKETRFMIIYSFESFCPFVHYLAYFDGCSEKSKAFHREVFLFNEYQSVDQKPHSDLSEYWALVKMYLTTKLKKFLVRADCFQSDYYRCLFLSFCFRLLEALFKNLNVFLFSCLDSTVAL